MLTNANILNMHVDFFLHSTRCKFSTCYSCRLKRFNVTLAVVAKGEVGRLDVCEQ